MEEIMTFQQNTAMYHLPPSVERNLEDLPFDAIDLQGALPENSTSGYGLFPTSNQESDYLAVYNG